MCLHCCRRWCQWLLVCKPFSEDTDENEESFELDLRNETIQKPIQMLSEIPGDMPPPPAEPPPGQPELLLRPYHLYSTNADVTKHRRGNGKPRLLTRRNGKAKDMRSSPNSSVSKTNDNHRLKRSNRSIKRGRLLPTRPDLQLTSQSGSSDISRPPSRLGFYQGKQSTETSTPYGPSTEPTEPALFRYLKNPTVLYGSRCDEYITYGQHLGSGGFSRVFLIKRSKDQKYFAGKCSVESNFFYKSYIHREYCILTGLSHPNIVKAHDILQYSAISMLVLDYFPAGCLTKFDGQKIYPEKQVIMFMRQGFSALAYLHQRRIQHNDIKPENMMITYIDNQPHLVLIDFGLANVLPPDRDYIIGHSGTSLYMAPEHLSHNKMAPKGDVWSMAVTAFQLLTGKLPFENEAAIESLAADWADHGVMVSSAYKSLSKLAQNFLENCLNVQYNTRYSAIDALQHPWLQIDETGCASDETSSLSSTFQQKTKISEPIRVIKEYFEKRRLDQARRKVLDKRAARELSLTRNERPVLYNFLRKYAPYVQSVVTRDDHPSDVCRTDYGSPSSSSWTPATSPYKILIKGVHQHQPSKDPRWISNYEPIAGPSTAHHRWAPEPVHVVITRVRRRSDVCLSGSQSSPSSQMPASSSYTYLINKAGGIPPKNDESAISPSTSHERWTLGSDYEKISSSKSFDLMQLMTFFAINGVIEPTARSVTPYIEEPIAPAIVPPIASPIAPPIPERQHQRRRLPTPPQSPFKSPQRDRHLPKQK